MSSLTAFFTVCAVLAVGLPFCLWQIHRAWRAEQAANCDPYEVCPDSLRLLNDLDEYLNEYVVADPDLWEVFGIGGPWDVLGHDTTTTEEGQ